MREAGTEEQSGVSHLHWNVDLSSSQDLLRTHLLTASLCLQVVATSPPCYQCLDRSLKIIAFFVLEVTFGRFKTRF